MASAMTFVPAPLLVEVVREKADTLAMEGNASPRKHALAAAVGYLHLYARGTGVQGVLGELLDHRGGAVDDLSGGDLLCHEGIE